MNYKKIYRKLMIRAKNESRTKTADHYYERHHIVPDFMFKNRKRTGPKGHLDGNPDDPQNLVLLTPREHLLAHMMLYRILKNTHYGYAAGSAMAFFFSKVIDKHPRQKHSNMSENRKYEWCRTIGRSSISRARKGKFPAKDAITGFPVGSVSVDHQKVLSGEWIHVTKGRIISQAELSHRKSQKGANNSNYKEMTEERKRRIFDLVPRAIIENHFQVKFFVGLLKEEFSEFTKISSVWILNNFRTYEEFLKECNEYLNTSYVYDPYFRSTQQKDNSRKRNVNKRWYTDGIRNITIRDGETVPSNFKRGRTIC